MTREELQRQVEEDQAAVRRAQEQSQRIEVSLERSQRVRRRFLPRLRQAGQAR